MIQGVKYLKSVTVRDFSLETFQQSLRVGILGSSSYSLSFQGKVAFSYKIVLSILWIWF